MKIDDINLAIIRHLREGKKSFQVIAKELEITENTVRARVNKMTEEGILEITGLVDPEKIQGHQVALIGIKLATMALVKKGKEFSALNGVISVCVVTGRYDLFVTILLNDEYDLLRFYTEEVSRVKDVQSAETFVVYKGYGLKIPYTL